MSRNCTTTSHPPSHHPIENQKATTPTHTSTTPREHKPHAHSHDNSLIHIQSHAFIQHPIKIIFPQCVLLQDQTPPPSEDCEAHSEQKLEIAIFVFKLLAFVAAFRFPPQKRGSLWGYLQLFSMKKKKRWCSCFAVMR